MILVRLFGWATLAVLAAFLTNNFLTVWAGWPGALGRDSDPSSLRSWVQTGLYAAAIILAAIYVFYDRERTLRLDRHCISNINSYLIRAAFWAVLLIGLVDFSLAFLGGEDLLDGVAGEMLARNLMRAEFRGNFVHMPLLALACAIAALTRYIGIPWLAVLIVIAELLIAMSRFIFSYEQAYMSDLVRFWYAALFLFGCAYTLREEGHVRVDVAYAHFTSSTKGLVNALGTLTLGMPFCWLILAIGMSGKTGIINIALLSYEIEGVGDGMYTLYLMTVFMGLFAITMLIEFVGVLFDAMADFHHEPGASGNDASLLQ